MKKKAFDSLINYRGIRQSTASGKVLFGGIAVSVLVVYLLKHTNIHKRNEVQLESSISFM